MIEAILCFAGFILIFMLTGHVDEIGLSVLADIAIPENWKLTLGFAGGGIPRFHGLSRGRGHGADRQRLCLPLRPYTQFPSRLVEQQVSIGWHIHRIGGYTRHYLHPVPRQNLQPRPIASLDVDWSGFICPDFVYHRMDSQAIYRALVKNKPMESRPLYLFRR